MSPTPSTAGHAARARAGRIAALSLGLLVLGGIGSPTLAAEPAPEPVRVIFDTDIGNDIDDALALGVLHALESRGACRLLAVTISKGHPAAAACVDAINHFYGRGAIPLGQSLDAPTPEPGNYLEPLVQAVDDGRPRYPRRLEPGAAPSAVAVLRQVLAAQPDGSVVLVVVGFSTNLARLLDSPPDAYSPLAGRGLVARKVRLLSQMAGMFSAEGRQREYNVYVDVPSARRVYAEWPTELVASGFEIGLAIKFPAQSIERDFGYVPHHPLAEAYRLYQPMPYDRECWDLTSVLYGVHPERGYFSLSPPGQITVDDNQVTQFEPRPDWRHRYLIASPAQVERVREALVQLASQPPSVLASAAPHPAARP